MPAAGFHNENTTRRGRDGRLLRPRQTGNPENRAADFQNEPRGALRSRHLGVDEDVLELLRAAETDRAQPITRLRIAQPQRRSVQRREIEDRAPRPGVRRAARCSRSDLPAGDAHRFTTLHAERQAG
jgi:hypothetical protein